MADREHTKEPMRIRPLSQVWLKTSSLALALLLSISGCRKTTPPGANVVSGKMGDTAYTFLHWKEGLRVMLWFDRTDEVWSAGSGSTEDTVHKMEGYASSAEGRRVEWQLETADGKTAAFRLDGQPYDLARGALFLVTTTGPSTQVRQLDRDLSAVQPTNAGCEAFSETDPDVSLFIRSTQGAWSFVCPVTEPLWLKPPDDPAVQGSPEPGYYYVNQDRSMWASAWWKGQKEDALRATEEGVKVGWFRPAGADLEITGRRLDSESPPLEAHLPCCYPTRFQASGLVFPMAGCWEVTAKAAHSQLSFVVSIGS